MSTQTMNPQVKKLERTFSALDRDKNGYLEYSDFQAIVDGIGREFGHGKDSRQLKALATAYRKLWDDLVRHADTDNDNRISKQEYIESSVRTVDDTARFDSIVEPGNAVFDVIDTDGDGQISEEEFARLQQVWGVTAKNAIETFRANDADGDGMLSRQELIKGIREYFASPNYDHPGNWFFGRP
ncbi:EF-hand domain-containing protein [Streptomyces noursei]|uniref:EF-hand domain-containing protein n=1 Tax=Streptomyces noursei TaxID=1971 RepID=UPI0033DEBE54